jgi:hypothetical protein
LAIPLPLPPQTLESLTLHNKNNKEDICRLLQH